MPAFPTPAASFPAVTFARSDADPLASILRAYDRAVLSCESFDHAAARRAIGLLRRALDLDTPEARSFDSLYAWCESRVDQRDFVGAARCLRTLREAWNRVGHASAFATRDDLPVS